MGRLQQAPAVTITGWMFVTCVVWIGSGLLILNYLTQRMRNRAVTISRQTAETPSQQTSGRRDDRLERNRATANFA